MKKNNQYVLLAVLFIVAIATISGMISSTGQITGRATQSSSQPDQTCREVTETYTETVPYTVQEPYEAVEDYDYYPTYSIVQNKKSGEWNFDRGYFARNTVKIKNTGDSGTWYTVTSTFETLQDGEKDVNSRHFIEPDETITFVNEYDVNTGENWQVNNVNVDIESVIKQRTVTKHRTVTKYRDEEKTRIKTVCE
ncbi:hypothetical protein ACFLQN_00925 [Candidatus Aenigmatarchaeota archaeon]